MTVLTDRKVQVRKLGKTRHTASSDPLANANLVIGANSDASLSHVTVLGLEAFSVSDDSSIPAFGSRDALATTHLC